MGHRQRGASLTTTRGDDGATGARTHAQPEAVDLRATPVVRLKRTLAHYWLQGRVRKMLRRPPMVCGALQCVCRGRDVVWMHTHERRQNQRHKHIRRYDLVGAGSNQTRPRRSASVCAGASRSVSVTTEDRLPEPLWTSGRPQGVRVPQRARSVDNLSLWITYRRHPSRPRKNREQALHTPSDLQIVDNFRLCTADCHPVDKPVHNVWTTGRTCGYPEVVKALVTQHRPSCPQGGSGREVRFSSGGAAPAPPPGEDNGSRGPRPTHGSDTEHPLSRPLNASDNPPEQIRTEGTATMAGHLG